MIKADKYYLEYLNEISENGSTDLSGNVRPKYKDGTPAYSKYITHVIEQYDILKGEFPITTLRNTAVKTGIKEIFWIYQKQTNSLKIANEMGITWWNDWNIGNDSIGSRYGYTVNKYDLMNKLLNGLENDPFSRRHIMNLYQYSDFEETSGLYPCAFETIWSVREKDNEYLLDIQLNQRSSDFLTAKNINSSQYLALGFMVRGHLSYKTNKKWNIGKFTHIINNLHIYDRHEVHIKELINRTPLDDYPYFELNENKNFYDYVIEDFNFYNFEKPKKLDSQLELAI
jgi:thymidylate synthase